MKSRPQPHWLVPVVVGLILALLAGWLGLNDWRFPFSRHTSDATPSEAVSRGPVGLAGPVHVTKLSGQGIDVSWTIVDNAELHGYAVYVTAVRPVQYTYGAPRYAGDSDVTERMYPVEYLNGLLADAHDERRVQQGQVWYVCVQAMKETPLNVPIDPYIIPGTKACSDEFVLP